MRRTTLAAPAAWAAASTAAVTCNAGWSALHSAAPGTAAAHFAYLAGITTLAPFVALLGAKRPQDRAWKFIVASLVALLAFQDFRTWAIDPAVPPAPHAAWRWLMAGLAVMQLLNYLPTRFAAAACLACAGQTCLLAGWLPFGPVAGLALFPLGLGLLGFAALLAALLTRSRAQAHDGWPRIWLDFRDQYGALWALRVADRANAMAAQQDSAARLEWSGFRLHGDAGSQHPQQAEPIHAAFKAILARFISAEWLAARGVSGSDF